VIGAPGRLVGNAANLPGGALRAIETILLLVVLATVVATFARWIRVPPPSLLVVAGVLVALIPGTPDIRVSPDVISLVVLPPLLYAAGEELSWRELRIVWRPVTVLAVGLVLTSAAAVGAITVWTAGVPASVAFVLGAVLASTDPVAVSALGRALSLPPRLQTLVLAESLFNDATSLILFRLSVGVAVAGGAVAWGQVAGEFALLAGGGALVGAALACGVAVIRARTEDPVVESVAALCTPYVAYVLAETMHASGVTAVVVVAVIIGLFRHRLTTPRTRLQLAAVYPTVIFLLESVVFSLIGLQLPGLVRRLSAADQPWVGAAIAITAALLVVRVVWVLPVAVLAERRWHQAGGGVFRLTAVMAWAGTRGVVPLAAALSIPLVDAAGRPLAQRDLLLVLATAVIAISLVFQGFTLGPLVRRSGLAVPTSDTERETRDARRQVAQAAIGYLEELADLEAVAPPVLERVRQHLQTRVDMQHDHEDEALAAIAIAYRQLRHDVVAVQAAELARMYSAHQISDGTYHRVQRQLDLEDARLNLEP
jgi:Na+/H+ antiporter